MKITLWRWPDTTNCRVSLSSLSTWQRIWIVIFSFVFVRFCPPKSHFFGRYRGFLDSKWAKSGGKFEGFLKNGAKWWKCDFRASFFERKITGNGEVENENAFFFSKMLSFSPRFSPENSPKNEQRTNCVQKGMLLGKDGWRWPSHFCQPNQERAIQSGKM